MVRAACPVDAVEAQQRLARAVADRLGPGTPRLWTRRAAASSDDARGAAAVRAEAERPVHPAGPPLRAVLVEYTDDAADLVLVAARDRVSREALTRLAAQVLDGPEGAAGDFVPSAPPERPTRDAAPRPAPEWGLGSPTGAGQFRRVAFRLPAPAAGTVPGDALAVAAVSLALARYEGRPQVRLDVVPEDAPTGGPAALALAVDETGTVAGHLGHCRTETSGPPGATAPAQEPAGVLLVLGRSLPGVRHLPFLAPPAPVTLHVEQQPDGSATGTCWFEEGDVDPEVGAMFAGRIAHVAAQLAQLPGDTPLSAVSALSTAEAAEVLRLGGLGSPTAAPPPGTPATIHGRIAATARSRPDAIALTDDSTQLTYRQLDERAEAMAEGLAALGTDSGRVGVCLDRDAGLVVALLAVLKAGCSYVPMDSRYPEERLRYTASDAGVRVVVGDPETFPRIDGVRVIGPKELEGIGADRAARGSARRRDGRDPERERPDAGAASAYVIYTSGSTGRPKGVVVPHRNVTALVDATAPDFGLTPADVWTLFHSSAFDFSVWEIWGALLTGGRLVVVPYWVARAPDEFHELLASERVTVLSQTPSAFRQLVEADRQSGPEAGLAVRLVVFGGEPLDVVRLAPWFTRYSPSRCRLVNMFGITETTVHVTAQTVTPAEVLARSRSVGRALPGWSVSVRDPHGRLLPPGAAGEIHVGGAGVADRYLGRPELTAERFVDDPLTGARVYRSGDRGRLRPDGRLDHLGRLDNQVKVRGHRIELDEIRSVLLAVPGVEVAAVALRQETPGDSASTRIDAYVVLGAEGTEKRAWDAARRVLPDYMTPATITAVPDIPLTLNGKLDTSRLPEPRLGQPEPSAPRTEEAPASGPDSGQGTDDGLAGTVLAVWSDLLGVPVRTSDNFFELGGNSLLVVRLLSELRSRGLPRVTTRQFYSNSSADRFIALVAELVAEAAAQDNAS
ncbi:non-ribosomal peptide synthetase [Streptomyces sp. NPDC057697]|uniref:non-ribosomal peptide synthetase n=1 Tax=Streptomyces sp. NPDC057697 TaxID=3346219 RepID=UPI00367BC352